MSKYIDGFVIPVAKANIEQYREIAQKASEIWKEYGALDYYETVGDDLETEGMLSFKTIAGASDNETVIFSWIVYESREHRDQVNAAVMEDARIKEIIAHEPKPFDYDRMAYGGFKTLVTF
ncbi:MAG: DUF1428 domain-containing protein [Acidobacteriota bacterium]